MRQEGCIKLLLGICYNTMSEIWDNLPEASRAWVSAKQ